MQPVRRLGGPLHIAFAYFKPDVIHDNGLWLPPTTTASPNSLRETRRFAADRQSPGHALQPWAIRHKAWKKKVAWRPPISVDLIWRRAACRCTPPPRPRPTISAELGLAGPIFIIPNGVELPDLAPPELAPPGPGSDPRVRTAAFLGRLYPVKGLPMLVEAWARVRPPAGWRLLIAGPDEAGHRRVVERAVAAAGLGEVVTLLGPVAGAAKAALLRDADLFVLPSYSESFGMAVAEALAHATPVLTTIGGALAWPWKRAAAAGARRRRPRPSPRRFARPPAAMARPCGP